MTQATTPDEIADDICRDCGYEPELKRSLDGFQMFAIAFASMSVVMGIFATYDDVTADPPGHRPKDVLWRLARLEFSGPLHRAQASRRRHPRALCSQPQLPGEPQNQSAELARFGSHTR